MADVSLLSFQKYIKNKGQTMGSNTKNMRLFPSQKGKKDSKTLNFFGV